MLLTNFKKISAVLALTAFTSLFTQAETVKMGVAAVAPPYSFQGEGAVQTGFKVELMQAIGKEAGFDVQIIPMSFLSAINDLEKGEIDVIGHIYGSKEREEQYNLIHVYDDAYKFLRVKEKSDDNIETPLSDNTKVSVISDSPQNTQLESIKHDQLPNIEINAEDTNFLAFKNLFLKRSDIMLAPISEINYLRNNYKDFDFQILDMPDQYIQSTSVNFAIKKDNADLANRIQAGLDTVKANGTFDTLLKKYSL